jgi:ribosome biogenesis GTPase A
MMHSVKIFFVSSVSREGVKKIEEYMGDTIKRIQLFGLPNTGKTTLLNKLLNSDKITSSIPGTTIRIS